MSGYLTINSKILSYAEHMLAHKGNLVTLKMQDLSTKNIASAHFSSKISFKASKGNSPIPAYSHRALNRYDFLHRMKLLRELGKEIEKEANALKRKQEIEALKQSMPQLKKRPVK